MVREPIAPGPILPGARDDLVLPVLPIGQLIGVLVAPGFGSAFPEIGGIGRRAALRENHLPGGKIGISLQATMTLIPFSRKGST